MRIATLTKKGRELHSQIIGIALERERAFLSALQPDEVATLINLLQRLHENLPMVEAATARYVKQNFPKVTRRRVRGTEDDDA